MLQIDLLGQVRDSRVRLKVFPSLHKGTMKVVRGIIIHQTDSPTAEATLNGYAAGSDHGSHFLIAKDGTIFQTASLLKMTHHVGWIKARCISEHRCSPKELAALQSKRPGRPIGQVELRKSWPSRFPHNGDSIGIELVGEALPKTDDVRSFEPLTDDQQQALSWIVRGLAIALGIQFTEVFRHPDVSWKNETEAKSARW